MSDKFKLAKTAPSEVRLSADGSRIFSAGDDGFVRVYDAGTGTLLDRWNVGQNLGGMDISPDDSFLVVVDRDISAVYRVDTTTGATKRFGYTTGAWEGLIFDVAVLADGTALFTQDFPGSGWVSLKVLDLATGTFTAGKSVNQSSVLSRSADGELVFVGEPNSSGGEVAMYRTGEGIVAQNGAPGYNWGIQAFSGKYAASYVGGSIYVWDAELKPVATIQSFDRLAVADLAFSADSRWMYVLDMEANSIAKLSTRTWETRETIDIGADVGTWQGMVGATFGSRLILDPTGRYFTVRTDTGLLVVDNPDAPVTQGSRHADVIGGSLFADDIRGRGGDDDLRGGNADDRLVGGNGVDRLDGGDGADVLTGGIGPDVLAGGAGADSFVFVPADVGGGADRIVDFSQADGDVIVLTRIDADVTSRRGAFTFIGQEAFHGVAGELRYGFVGGGTTVIEGDVDGNGTADLVITLDGTVTLTASDFAL